MTREPRLIIEENHDLPLVRVCLTFERGVTDDPPGHEGLAYFASELARRGAAGHGREEIDAHLDTLGADLGVSPGHDAVSYDLQVLSRNLDPALDLVADIVLRPDFRPEEAQQLRRESQAGLDDLEEDDPQLARRFFQRQLFGDGPYGTPAIGTRASLDRIDAEAARGWMAQAAKRQNLLVGFAGDVDAGRARESVLGRFGALPQGASPRAALPRAPHAHGVRIALVDKPERTQSQILIGQPAPAWADPDFLPLQVATNAFGGTFTARLMNEVRSKRGLSYGASARLVQGRGPRMLFAYVFPAIERTGETLQLVLDLWRDWVEHGLGDEEFRFARENLASSFVCDLVTPEDRLDLRLATALYGLPADYLETAPARIRAVTREEVHAAMARHLRARDLTVTVLGTADEVLEQLEAIEHEGEITVLEYDDL